MIRMNRRFHPYGRLPDVIIWRFVVLLWLCSRQTLSLCTRPFQLQQIRHIVLNCQGDFDAMVEFYTETLGCSIVTDDSASMILRDDDDAAAGNTKYRNRDDKKSAITTRLKVGDYASIDLVCQKNHHQQQNDMASSETAAVSSKDQQYSFSLQIQPFDASKLQGYFERKGVEILPSTTAQGGATNSVICIQDPDGNLVQLTGTPAAEKDGDDHLYFEASSNEKEDMLLHHDQVPSTPCTRICRYNADFFDGQVCIGCYREAYEIGTWTSMSPYENTLQSWTQSIGSMKIPIATIQRL